MYKSSVERMLYISINWLKPILFVFLIRNWIIVLKKIAFFLILNICYTLIMLYSLVVNSYKIHLYFCNPNQMIQDEWFILTYSNRSFSEMSLIFHFHTSILMIHYHHYKMHIFDLKWILYELTTSEYSIINV